MKKESAYLKAARCEEVEHFPVWLMRQAGRYMKVYRKLREKYSMLEIIKSPELACEVTMQPIKAFGLDAAIIFSDILTIPEGLNLGLEFVEGKGPVLAKTIMTQSDVDALDVDLIPGNVDYVIKAIELTKSELRDIPLIGFAGSPFTVASYMLGGRKRDDLISFMPMVLSNLPMVCALLDKLSTITIRYLDAQIKAGIDAIQIFDSWSNYLSWSMFKELSIPYLRKIIQGLNNPKNIPITVFGTNYSVFYPLLDAIGANVISIDSHADIAVARKSLPKHIAVQGNLDPNFLLGPRELLKEQTLSLLDSMKGTKGFIFNLGHGVLPNVPEDNVKFLVDLVKNYRAI